MSESHIVEGTAEMRLDQWLLQTWSELDRRQVRQMIQKGRVQVNAQPAQKAGQYVQPGDSVTVSLPEMPPPEKESQNPFLLPLNVVHEDEVIIVVEKPAGMAMYASRDGLNGSLVQQLVAYCPQIAHIGGAEHAGVVMRAEPEISGLVIAAKDETTYRMLRRAFNHQKVETVYSVLVEGRLTGEGVIEQPVGNVKRTRVRLNVAREGRPARTCYRGQRHYKENGKDYSLLEVRPETSRLHQIRVHLSWYGFPVVGDRVYGSRYQPLLPDRIFLHLSALTFPHPLSGEPTQVESRLPPELYSVLRYLVQPKR
ncbi:MAG: RluA family pseudouridine synthase [Anaerolineae bacterium]|nr:RluA family pseudouridine synthase [Anaerolineae bacterium]